MTNPCTNCALSSDEPCEWCCEAPESIGEVRCGCWRNPDTGLLEACAEHEGWYMDRMMEFEAWRDAGEQKNV